MSRPPRRKSQPRRDGESLDGTVVRMNARHAVVRLADDQSLRCTLRKSLFHNLEVFTAPIAVGDRVRVTRFGPRDAVVEEVLPRRGYLSRRLAESRKEQVLVANVDQVVICAALRLPDLRIRLVDRVLVAAERAKFDGLIAFTKIDLVEDRAPFEELAQRYTEMGYPSILVSNETGEGVEELAARLKDRTSVLSGPSGAGKSTTLNSIQPGFELPAQTVSERWGKGKHTTSAASLLPLEIGGYVVDTPGYRSFGIAGLEPADVAIFMPDFAHFIEHCHLSDCTHLHEPDCAIQMAVEEGFIHPDRFESYRRMAEGIDEEDEMA